MDYSVQRPFQSGNFGIQQCYDKSRGDCPVKRNPDGFVNLLTPSAVTLTETGRLSRPINFSSTIIVTPLSHLSPLLYFPYSFLSWEAMMFRWISEVPS